MISHFYIWYIPQRHSLRQTTAIPGMTPKPAFSQEVGPEHKAHMFAEGFQSCAKPASALRTQPTCDEEVSYFFNQQDSRHKAVQEEIGLSHPSGISGYAYGLTLFARGQSFKENQASKWTPLRDVYIQVSKCTRSDRISQRQSSKH